MGLCSIQVMVMGGGGSQCSHGIVHGQGTVWHEAMVLVFVGGGGVVWANRLHVGKLLND